MTTKGRSWKVEGKRQYSSRPKVDTAKQERRAKVLKLFKEHKTIREISEQLHLDRGTVSGDIKYSSRQGEVNFSDVQTNVSLSRRRNWVNIIQTILDDVIPYFASQGVKPSLRTAYYRLRARGLIGKTIRDYNNLKTHTKEARLKETDKSGRLLYPVLPIGCFADETRKLIDNYSDYKPTEVKDPDEYIDEAIQTLTDEITSYDGSGTKGGRWYGQPEYVEVWIEKFADAPTFEKWLEDKDVNIVVNKGYTSISFLWENIKRLKEKVKEFKGFKHVHVQYFGDFDPSGEDMVKSLQKYFKRFGLSPSIIKKIALTQKQIDDYEIPLEPVNIDDNRYASFEAEYGTEGAEIDAFIATKPEELKQLLRDSVDEHFDQAIYDEMEKKYKTSTPLDELKDIHDNMIYTVQHAFGSTWQEELKEELEEIYEDMNEDEDEDENTE
jgi:hypothetical protein